MPNKQKRTVYADYSGAVAMKTFAKTCLWTTCCSFLAGCQTWVPEAGLTLPSGRYLQHPPQYIPRSPQFPLEREMESLMEAYNAQPRGPDLGATPPFPGQP